MHENLSQTGPIMSNFQHFPPFFGPFSNTSGSGRHTGSRRQPLAPRKIVRVISITGLCATLGACATYRDVPPNSPRSVVYETMGQPSLTCPLDSGGDRSIWTLQPNGQYAYGARFNAAGITDRVESILTDANFRKLDTGIWTADDVRCEFGPPARITRSGLGEKNEVVWEYRYKQANVWNSLMYVYFGRDGERVTHYHPGPDPAFEREFEFMGF